MAYLNKGNYYTNPKLPDGSFEDFELDVATKTQLTDDPELIACLDKMVIDSCTGKIVYDVACWAMNFNDFILLNSY